MDFLIELVFILRVELPFSNAPQPGDMNHYSLGWSVKLRNCTY